MNANDYKLRMQKRRLFFTATILFMLTLCATALTAQTNNDRYIKTQLEAVIKNKIVIIRHFYSGSNLKYSSKGEIISGGESGSWTINAYFEPKKIKLSKKSITISGNRICWTYNSLKNKPSLYRDEYDVKIEIARADEQNGLSEISESLLTVFLKNEELLEDFVPSYWKKIIRAGFDTKQIMNELSATEQTLNEMPLAEPSLLQHEMYEFTEKARKFKLSGIVLLKGIIDKNGNAKVTDILKPLGAGMDDNAVRTIEKTWKFSPAMSDGGSIQHDASFEVHFKLI